MKDADRISLSHGSSEPGVIRLDIKPERNRLPNRVRLTPAEAAELAARLLSTVGQLGFEVTARKRPAR